MKFLERAIDAIPTINPETGDRLVNLTLAFIAGFVFALIIFGA
jgi:capsular polysaccharide biosynthesis protein